MEIANETGTRTEDDSFARTLVRSLALAFLFVAPALLSTMPSTPRGALIDPDIFWHLRTGEWIHQHHALPATDPFSQFGHGKPWIAYSWLFELVVYGLHRAFGWTGIVIYRAVFWVAISIALHRLVSRRQRSFVAAFWITGLGVTALLSLCEVRPWLVTMLFFTVELDLLDAAPGSRAVLALPVLFALWANIHIQFVYGLFVLVVYAFEPLLARTVTRITGGSGDPGAVEGKLSPRLLAVTAACFAATLLTPYHIHVYDVLYEYASQTRTFDLISELGAMPFRHLSDWCVFGVTLGAAMALGWRRDRRWARYVVLATAAYCGFRAMRDIWFVTIVSVTILADVNVPWLSSAPPMRARRLPILLAAIVVVPGLGLVVHDRERLNRYLDEWIAHFYPARAAAAIEKAGYRGPLYNPFTWGGYLIWRLPELPVSMDGRTNLYGPDRIERNVLTFNGMLGWERDPELAKAGIVVINPWRNCLHDLLRSDPRFELAYVDSTAVVYVARRSRAER